MEKKNFIFLEILSRLNENKIIFPMGYTIAFFAADENSVLGGFPSEIAQWTSDISNGHGRTTNECKGSRDTLKKYGLLTNLYKTTPQLLELGKVLLPVVKEIADSVPRTRGYMYTK
jgi:hypothetical protein